jgi:23S rRNA A2030 N6-methylase RlmJ
MNIIYNNNLNLRERRYSHDEKAANLHDVWKHFVLVEYLQTRLRKVPQKMTYIDTHAGAFTYKNSNMLQTASGILNMKQGFESLPECKYKEILANYGAHITRNEEKTVVYYPGSLAFSSWLLQNRENIVLGCDTNPEMVKKCKNQSALFNKMTKSHIIFDFFNEDGFVFAQEYVEKNRMRNGVVFIDPPYFPNEHEDWESAFELIDLVARKAPAWSLVQWYCVYTDSPSSSLGYYHETMAYLKTLAKIASTINISLQIRPLSSDYAKAISGLIIVNPRIDEAEFSASLFHAGIKKIVNSLALKDNNWGPLFDIKFIG